MSVLDPKVYSVNPSSALLVESSQTTKGRTGKDLNGTIEFRRRGGDVKVVVGGSDVGVKIRDG